MFLKINYRGICPGVYLLSIYSFLSSKYFSCIFYCTHEHQIVTIYTSELIKSLSTLLKDLSAKN